MMTGEGSEMIAVSAMKLWLAGLYSQRENTASALKRAVERATERSELLRKMEQYRIELERSNHDPSNSPILWHTISTPYRTPFRSTCH